MLTKEHGSPTLNNKPDPFDELVFIVLSQMTTSPSYERVFQRLKNEIKDWNELVDMPLETLVNLIRDAGLSQQRANRLKQIAFKLANDFGDVSLSRIYKYDDEALELYLSSLPGVGVKTARCVMMYSLGRTVLPVDTHTARLGIRLGLVESGSFKAVTSGLDDVISPELRFDFHVNAVCHGRSVCRAINAKCDSCVLLSTCPTGKRDIKV